MPQLAIVEYSGYLIWLLGFVLPSEPAPASNPMGDCHLLTRSLPYSLWDAV